MIMLCEMDQLNDRFSVFVDLAEKLGEENNLKIHVMHEDIFHSMHRI